MNEISRSTNSKSSSGLRFNNRKKQDRQNFASDRVWKIWNTKYAGKEAFTALTKGYKSGRIKGVLYLAHRVIWIMIKGFDPIEVDHEDGNRSNNIWANLRNATRLINSQNQKKRTDNSSGQTGVSWNKRKLKWEAYIHVNRKRMPLGMFENVQDAITVRKQAEKDYGYHPNHGR